MSRSIRLPTSNSGTQTIGESSVVLSPVAQADGRIKNRPALVLREFPPYGDLLICGFSTQLHQRVMGFDELLMPSDPDFAASGLRVTSLIRLGFLSVVPQDSIAGAIGAVSPERHQRLLQRLSQYLIQRLGNAHQ